MWLNSGRLCSLWSAVVERDRVNGMERDTLTTYCQVAAVMESTPPFTAAAAAAAADCQVHLCHPPPRIYDINCPSAVFTDRDRYTAASGPSGCWKWSTHSLLLLPPARKRWVWWRTQDDDLVYLIRLPRLFMDRSPGRGHIRLGTLSCRRCRRRCYY